MVYNGSTDTAKGDFMKSIGVKTIKEIQNEGIEYVMIKVNISDKEAFCICVLGEEMSFESLGKDYHEAKERFDLISQNGVSALHLEEILHDIKMKICF